VAEYIKSQMRFILKLPKNAISLFGFISDDMICVEIYKKILGFCAKQIYLKKIKKDFIFS
jgi:uncharacterized membrane protein